MAAIIWPCAMLVPRNIAVDLAHRSVAGPSSVSGFGQVVASDAGLWKATYDSIPVHDQKGLSLVKLWRAIAILAEGRLNPILICIHDIERQPIPAGVTYDDFGGQVPHSDDAFFSDDSGYVSSWINVVAAGDTAARAVSMTVTVNYAGEIEPGQHFSIGERLYRVRSFNADTGVMTFRPPLREAVTAGTALNFDSPVVRVRLASDAEMDLPLEFGRWSFPSVSFIEDL